MKIINDEVTERLITLQVSEKELGVIIASLGRADKDEVMNFINRYNLKEVTENERYKVYDDFYQIFLMTK